MSGFDNVKSRHGAKRDQVPGPVLFSDTDHDRVPNHTSF
jgi:hypothetical protein